MWGEYLAPGEKREPGLQYTADHLRTDEKVWRDLTARMQKRRFDMKLRGQPLQRSEPGTPRRERDEISNSNFGA